MFKRTSHIGLALILAVSSLGAGACKPGKKKKSKSKGSVSVQTSTPPPGQLPAAADNGLANKPARVVLNQVVLALRGTKSVRMRGTIADGGGAMAVNMNLTQLAGKGTITQKVKGQPVTAELVAVGGRFYLRGRKFWMATGGQAVAARMGDKWAAIPTRGAPKAGAMSIAMLTRGFQKTRRIVKGKPGMLAGQRVIRLIDMSDRSVLYIPTTGKALPLRMSKGKGFVDYTAYNAPVTITRPTNVVRLGR